MSKKKTNKPEIEVVEESKEQKDVSQVKNVSKHGKRYNKVRLSLDSQLSSTNNKMLTVEEAVEFLKKNSNTKFVETVELHINVIESGLKGEVLLPYSTGKTVRIAVADESVIEKLDKNIIDFDILVSTPAMMPKLTKYAKILGPKGLMPNPKSGTVGANTADIVQKFSGNTLRYKTEPKAPIIHMSVGKIDFTSDKLIENINTIIKSLDKKNLKSIFISATMSPSIELKI